MSNERVVKAPESYEKAALEFLEYVEGRIKDVHEEDRQIRLARKNKKRLLTDDDKWDLETAYMGLRSSFDGLAKNFFEPEREQKPHRVESGYHFAWGLMYSAFLAGRGTMVSESGKAFVRAEGAALARKAIPARGDKPLLDDIIALAKSKNLTVAKSPQCGGRLLRAGLKTDLTPKGLEKFITRNYDTFAALGLTKR